MSLSSEDFSKLLTHSSLLQASKLSLEKDKPLHFDYFISSYKKECKIVKTQDDKILFKSQDEYTSPLIKLLNPCANGNNDNTLICETQNSLYVVHNNMLKN
jgi:hypothetical protein